MSSSKRHIEVEYEILEMEKQGMQHMVTEYVADKKNSLDDRWEVWSKYSEKIHERYLHNYDGFSDFEDYMHDDFLQKHETVSYVDILECYEHHLEAKEEIFVRVKLQEMKEYLMEKNLGSYKFDW